MAETSAVARTTAVLKWKKWAVAEEPGSVDSPVAKIRPWPENYFMASGRASGIQSGKACGRFVAAGVLACRRAVASRPAGMALTAQLPLNAPTQIPGGKMPSSTAGEDARRYIGRTRSG
ncbi:MAG: hypothetical protein H7X97_07805 [Opitutaceae bacterium]|nr:hypothetical protein [Verrucomicrobiales bacterium]